MTTMNHDSNFLPFYYQIYLTFILFTAHGALKINIALILKGRMGGKTKKKKTQYLLTT
jgi:hypothetical protein